MKHIYVVGAYESPILPVFPTHVSPILAENVPAGWVRLNYTLENDGLSLKHFERQTRICPTINGMFPRPTYLKTPNPVRYRCGIQVIYLGNERFAIHRSKLILSLALLRCPTKMVTSSYWLTLRNIWR